MKLREALITQAPSLALQREAQAEIAKLDHLLSQRRWSDDELAAACQAAELSDDKFEDLLCALLDHRREALKKMR